MQLIGLQLDIDWENKPANFAKAQHLLTQAAPAAGSLLVLPELFATGFSMNTGAIAEQEGGQSEQFLAEMARHWDVSVLGGVARRAADGRVRNLAVAFSPAGQLQASYAKMRPFTPGGESQHYTAGEQPTVFGWGHCCVSPFVCYDLRFPELFRQIALSHRPELFTVIASWPEKRILHWVRLLQARAIENQAYVIGVNRVGSDPFYRYTGRSLIVDPQGEILADAGSAEGFIQAELDLGLLRQYRQGLPFLADMKA